MKLHIYRLNNMLLMLFLLTCVNADERERKQFILHTKDPTELGFIMLSSSLASELAKKSSAKNVSMKIVAPTYASGFYSELAQNLLENRVHDASVVRLEWYRIGANDAISFIEDKNKKGKSKSSMLISLGFVKMKISGFFLPDDSFVDSEKKIKAFIFSSNKPKEGFSINGEKSSQNKKEFTGWLSPPGHYVPGGQGETYSRIFILGLRDEDEKLGK